MSNKVSTAIAVIGVIFVFMLVYVIDIKHLLVPLWFIELAGWGLVIALFFSIAKGY
jgi:hypothetical protein